MWRSTPVKPEDTNFISQNPTLNYFWLYFSRLYTYKLCDLSHGSHPQSVWKHAQYLSLGTLQFNGIFFPPHISGSFRMNGLERTTFPITSSDISFNHSFSYKHLSRCPGVNFRSVIYLLKPVYILNHSLLCSRWLLPDLHARLAFFNTSNLDFYLEPRISLDFQGRKTPEV